MNQEHIKNPGKIHNFTDLIVWQKAHDLVLLVYSETKPFPKEEIFGLTSQMRRAAISVSSNIAEGFGRKSYKEKIQFYSISLGSLYELENQIYISKDLNYLSAPSSVKLLEQVSLVQRLLNAFISKSKTFL